MKGNVCCSNHYPRLWEKIIRKMQTIMKSENYNPDGDHAYGLSRFCFVPSRSCISGRWCIRPRSCVGKLPFFVISAEGEHEHTLAWKAPHGVLTACALSPPWDTAYACDRHGREHLALGMTSSRWSVRSTGTTAKVRTAWGSHPAPSLRLRKPRRTCTGSLPMRRLRHERLQPSCREARFQTL